MSNLPTLRRIKSFVFTLPDEVMKLEYSVKNFHLEQLNMSENDLENLFEAIISRINEESQYRVSLKLSGATSPSVSEMLTEHRGGLTISRFASRYMRQFGLDTHHNLFIDFDDMCELTRIIIAQSVIVPAKLSSHNVHIINDHPCFVAIYDEYAAQGTFEYDYISTWEILNAHSIFVPA